MRDLVNASCQKLYALPIAFPRSAGSQKTLSRVHLQAILYTIGAEVGSRSAGGDTLDSVEQLLNPVGEVFTH